MGAFVKEQEGLDGFLSTSKTTLCSVFANTMLLIGVIYLAESEVIFIVNSLIYELNEIRYDQTMIFIFYFNICINVTNVIFILSYLYCKMS